MPELCNTVFFTSILTTFVYKKWENREYSCEPACKNGSLINNTIDSAAERLANHPILANPR